MKAVASAKPSPEAPAHHSLFSLHTLGEGLSDVGKGASDVANAAVGAFHTTYKQPEVVKRGTAKALPLEKAAREGKSPALSPGLATASPINTASIGKGLLTAAKNTPGSAVRTITGIPGAVVAVGKAGVNLAEGHPQETLHILRGLGEVAEHPWTSFQKEPVGTALMFGGEEAGAGRAIGAAARSGMLGEKAAAAAETAREPLQLYNDMAIERKYSPDIIRKGAQVAADKFREKVLNENPNIATGTRLNRYLYGGGLLGQFASDKLNIPLQGAVKPGELDKVLSDAKAIQKMHTDAATGFMKSIEPKGQREAVPLIAEGTIRRPETVMEDLHGRLNELKHNGESLTGHEKAQNLAQQKQISDLLENPGFMKDPVPAFEAAKNFATHQEPQVDRKVQLGILEPDQRYAQLVSYATRHMGADYNVNPGKHPLVKDVAAARRALKSAKADLAHNATQDAKDRVLNIQAAHDRLSRDLAFMKASGAIKPNGEMWPRLEVNGTPLTHDEILAHSKANIGNRDLGYLTHREAKYGATESTNMARPAIERRARTGVSYKNGTYDSSWGALTRQARKDASDIARHEGKDEIARRFGFGSYHSQEEAAKAADNFNHTPEGERITKALGNVVPHHVGPDRITGRGNMPTHQIGEILSHFSLMEHKAIQELGPEGKFRLMPEAITKRIAEHEKVSQPGKLTKAMQNYTGKWRSTALFTTPRWPVGVGQENAIRLAFANVNPFAMFGLGPAVKLGKSLRDQFNAIASDPAETEARRFVARAQLAAMDSGQHYGSYIYNAIPHDEAVPAEAKSAMDAFTEHAPVSQTLKAWTGWRGFIGKDLKKLESNTKLALRGKVALDEAGRFFTQWRELLTRQDQAVKAYAKSKLTPAASAKLGEDTMKLAGNWTTLTPEVHKAVQTYSPFGLWWLNSMKFVFQTLPRDHPFKTAALAAMEAGTGVKPGEAQPEYLAGSIGVNLPIVGHVDITPLHYSPFGIGVEPEKTAAGMLLPQISDAALTGVGINPLSYEPETPPGSAKVPPGIKFLKGAEEIPAGLIPGLRPAETVLRAGGKPLPGSLNPIATKPGTKSSIAAALAKYLSPVPFTAAPAEEKGGRQIRERAVRSGHERERPARERPLRSRP